MKRAAAGLVSGHTIDLSWGKFVAPLFSLLLEGVAKE
jgi:hypothetical protein